MIKVTKLEDHKNAITAFIFECNTPDDHDSLDKLRVAILGDNFPKRGYYDNSNKLVIECKIPEVPMPEAES